MHIGGYMCLPCAEEGVVVEALVRMYPHAMWAGDDLVLDQEFLCCSRCYNPVAAFKDKKRYKPHANAVRRRRKTADESKTAVSSGPKLKVVK